MNTVLISGKQGAGKTSLVKGLANALIQHKILIMPLKFADPLYALHDAVYHVMGTYGIHKPDKKDGELLQLLGTEWARKKFGGFVWADIAKRRSKDFATVLDKAYEEQGVIEQVKDFQRIVMIDDCRYPEEVDVFSDAFKIRLECSEEARKNRAEYWRVNTQHTSEISLDDYGKFDLVIDTERKTQQETLALAVEGIRKYTCRYTTTHSEPFQENPQKN